MCVPIPVCSQILCDGFGFPFWFRCLDCQCLLWSPSTSAIERMHSHRASNKSSCKTASRKQSSLHIACKQTQAQTQTQRQRERDIHTHVHSFSRAPLMLCTHVRVILSRCQGVRCLQTAFTPSLLHCLAPPPLLHVSLLATPPATHAAAWRSLEATFRLLRCQHCMYVRMACVV